MTIRTTQPMLMRHSAGTVQRALFQTAHGHRGELSDSADGPEIRGRDSGGRARERNPTASIAMTMPGRRTCHGIGWSVSDVDVFSLGQCARRAWPRLDTWSFFRRWHLGATSAARGVHRHTPSSRSSGPTRSVRSVQCAGMCGTHFEHRWIQLRLHHEALRLHHGRIGGNA